MVDPPGAAAEEPFGWDALSAKLARILAASGLPGAPLERLPEPAGCSMLPWRCPAIGCGHRAPRAP
jgi:hypothetical protein